MSGVKKGNDLDTPWEAPSMFSLILEDQKYNNCLELNCKQSELTILIYPIGTKSYF